MATAMFCTAVLGLLVFGLGLGVSLQRGKTKTGAGYPDDPAATLYKWVRAHGNTTEYAPMMAILILALGARGPGALVQGTMIAATICRILIAVGMISSPTMANAHPLRFVGAVGTYITGLLLCVAMFFA